MTTWIVIGSANGSGNLGDEAMWHAAVSSLRDVAGDVDVITDSFDGAWGADGVPRITELPYLYSTLLPFPRLEASRSQLVRLAAKVVGRPFRWAAARRKYERALRGPQGELQQRWFDAIRDSSGVIISGAGAITDRYAVNGVYAWSLIAHWASQLGRPVCVLGQGVGPLSAAHVPVATAGLRSASFVGVRDQRSADLAASWGVPAPVKQPDWATLAVPSAEDRQRAATIADALGSPFVAACLHTVRGENHDKSLRTVMARIGHLANNRGMRVLLVPNMYGQGSNSDKSTMSRLLDGLPASQRTVFSLVDERLNARETRALLARAELVAATRYHSLVFAGAEARWTVGIAIDDYWHQKLVGAQLAAGQPATVLAADSTEEAIDAEISTALDNARSIDLSGIDGSAAAADLERFVLAQGQHPTA